MSVDSIGDFLTAIRNAIMVGKRKMSMPSSKMRLGIAGVLKQEGFIRDVIEATDGKTGHKVCTVFLRYVDDESVIHEITRMSKPGRRYYTEVGSIKPVIGNLGISILTTDRGVISHKVAKKFRVGGEVLCTVW